MPYSVTIITRVISAKRLLGTCVLAATACIGTGMVGTATVEASPKPLVVWTPGIPSPNANLWTQLASEFKKETGIPVDFENYSYGTILTKMTTAIASHTLPTVIIEGNGYIAATMARTGEFVVWNNATMGRLGVKPSEFIKSTLDSTEIPGQPPAGLPLYGGSWVMLYNKQDLKSAKVSPPSTWTQVAADAKNPRLYNPSEGRYLMAVPIGAIGATGTFVWILFKQFGGGFTRNGKIDLNSPQDVAAIDNLVSLVNPDHAVNPDDITDTTGTKATDEFDGNQAALSLTQSIEPVLQDPSRFGLTVMPMPARLPAGGQRVGSHVAAVVAYLSKTGASQPGAMALMKFFVSEKTQVQIARGNAAIPAVSAALKGLGSAYKAWGKIESEYAKPLPTGKFVTDEDTNIGDAAIALARDALSGPVSVSRIKAALDTAQATTLAQVGG